MKKWFKTGAKALALIASLVLAFNFVACSSDDDSDDDAPVLKSIITGGSVELLKGENFPTEKLVYAYYDNASAGTMSEPGSLAKDVTKKASFTSGSITIAAGSKIEIDVGIYELTVTFGGKTAENKLKLIVTDKKTVENEDGSTTVTTINADGSTEAVTTNTDGSTKTVTVDANGDAKVTIVDKDGGTTTYTPITMNKTVYDTIQEALDAIKDSGSYTIKLPVGTYEEMLFYTGSATITIEGTGTATYGSDVVIKYSNSGNTNSMAELASSHGVTSGYLRGATRFDGKCNLILKNVTIQNSYSRSANNGGNTQAEALVFSSTGNLIAYNSSFLSHQDTLYLGQKGGRMWFYKDYIEGDVDFIWGYMDVALFEECSLKCLGDETTKSYIFASRSMDDDAVNKGIVLLNNNIEVASGVTMWYGRNSGSDTTAAILNNTITGEGKIDSTLYQSAPLSYVKDVAGDLALGYKDYNNTFNGTVISTSNRLAQCGALSERVANREYNGRYVILNRGYSKSDAVYKTASTIWDISAYETEFNATEDASKANVYIDPVYVKNIVGGGTVQLTPSSDVAGLTYTYASSDEELATVDSNGLVTTKRGVDGTAVITVTASNGKKDTMSVKVISVEVPATAVNVTLASSSVAKYGVTTATVTFEPATTTEQEFTLTSSDSNVKFFDKTTQALAESTTVTAEEGTATVSVWVGGDVTGATLTAKSTAYESATAGTATVSTTAGSVIWGDTCAWRVATDIQKGTYGIYDGLVIDSTKTNSSLITDIVNTGKMSLKTNSKMQTRNVILYIPVEGASTIAINLASGSTGCKYYVGESASTTFTANDDNTVWTYEYDGSATGIVLGSAISGLGDLGKQAGEGISTNGKYLRVVIARDTADVYIASIKVQKTGDFTATWDETTQTGASGTYAFGDSTYITDSTTGAYASSDGFVTGTGLTADGKGHGYAVAADSKVTIHVAGITQIDVLGCAYGNGAPFTAKVDDTTLATVSSCKASTDGGVGATFYYTTAEAADIVITFTGAGWVHGIKVTALDSFTPVSSITVTAADNATSVYVGGALQLTATTNSDATNQSVTWSSGTPATATVSSDGVVTGVADGSVTITATANDGSGVTGTYTVTVSTNTAEETGPWTWDWKNGTTNGTDIQTAAGTENTIYAYDTSTSLISSNVYATVSYIGTDGKKCKLADNGNNAQFNTNTQIAISVGAGQTLEVSNYPNYTSYVVGTTGSTTTDTTTPTDNAVSVTNSTSSAVTYYITATGNGYLYSITLSDAE